MKLPEGDYFEYVIPAVILFILGLHYNSGKLKGEVLDCDKIMEFANRKSDLPYLLIAIGFVSSFLLEYMSADFSLVFYLLGGFKFIGVFLLILSQRRIKPFPLIIVYGSIISSSLGEGMFHDLLTWVIFLGCIYSIRYKPSIISKIALSTIFIVCISVLQLLKGGYRNAIGEKGEEAGLETLSKAYVAKNSESSGIFSLKSMAPSTARINQGFLITNIMQTVPSKVPFSRGKELYQILEAAILPRILAPDKLKAGDRTIFTKYSGIPIKRGTSMALSSIGDAYINFGIIGGCVFMFFLGLIYNIVLKIFYSLSKYYPLLLLFTPLVFYYPIRPDCELQTILGHLVKSCFLIFVIFTIWKKEFKVSIPTSWKKFSY
jgi:hypothetical protein